MEVGTIVDKKTFSAMKMALVHVGGLPEDKRAWVEFTDGLHH
jgi:hypothetical protein